MVTEFFADTVYFSVYGNTCRFGCSNHNSGLPPNKAYIRRIELVEILWTEELNSFDEVYQVRREVFIGEI